MENLKWIIAVSLCCFAGEGTAGIPATTLGWLRPVDPDRELPRAAS